MLSDEWKKLQNGSDVRGIALEGVEGEEVNLTPDKVYTIATAFAIWLSRKTKMGPAGFKIAVGMDSRLTGPSLKEAAIKGLKLAGCDVYDCGLASTPAMFMSTVMPAYKCNGSIMITASHLPFNRNGMKFFTKNGGLEKADITEVLEIAENEVPPLSGRMTVVEKVDLISDYAADLVRKIREATGKERPLVGMRIIVDAGNGAGGFYASKVLKPLGAETEGSQFLEPDGNFPNHIPNPENKEAMESVKTAVYINSADFGIIFDTDVDRAGAVDRHGKEINRNRIIALIAAIECEGHPGATIVTDSITSSGLKEFIEKDLGGVHHRYKRGYKNVINEAIRLNNEGKYTPVAIETSGHGALKDNYFLDDGAFLIAKLLIKMAQMRQEGKHIDELISKLKEPAESEEFRMKLGLEEFAPYGNDIIKELGRFAETVPGWTVEPRNYEGIRVKCDETSGNGWFLLRMSLHEPLMPLNIESDEAGGVDKIRAALKPFLSKYDKLDSSKL